MPRPTVLLVVRDLDFGGIQLMALRMLRGLRLPTELCVLAQRRVLRPEDVRAGGGEAEWPTELSTTSPSKRRLSSVAELRFLRREIRRRRPRAVFAFGYSTCALAVSATGGTPVVAGIRNSPLELQGRGVRAALKRAGVRRAVGRASRVVCISSGLAAEMRERRWAPSERVAVVVNGVDLERVRRLAGHESTNLSLPDRFVVTVGRLTPQKDIGLLLAAFARLAPDAGVHLVVVGEGPERQALAHQAAGLGLGQRVHFLGMLANPFPVVRRAAAFVLSSEYEGFGTVVVEAMALGVPVVAMDCPSGPREILDGGAYGELVTTRTPTALAAGLERALAPERSRALQVAGPQRAERFSLDAMLAAYSDVLAEVAERGR